MNKVKLAFVLVVVQCLVFTAVCAEIEKKKEFTLQFAIELDSSPTKIICTLKNTGEVDVETTPLATCYNRIVLVKPDGQEVESFSWKNFIKPVVIKPKEEKIFSGVLAHAFNLEDEKQPGTYRVYWKVYEVKSNELKISIPEKKE